MSYISHRQLSENPGARELAQVATPADERAVDDALMNATLVGSDRSQWSAEESAVADAALARIDAAVEQADATIDGFLRMRNYLPLADHFDEVPGIVTAWSRAISRYILHKDRIASEGTDPVVRDYQDALKLLRELAAGRFSLGAGDIQAATGVGSPEISAPPRIWTRDTLKDF